MLPIYNFVGFYRMTVGELAEKVGVTVRTIQYYDQENLLKPSAKGSPRSWRNEKQMEYYKKHNSLDMTTTFAEHTRIDKILKVSFAAFRVITLLFLKKGGNNRRKEG